MFDKELRLESSFNETRFHESSAKECWLWFEVFFPTLFPTSDSKQCKGVYCVDLGGSLQIRIYYLLVKFGLDTAENEPCKVCLLSVYSSI